MMTHTYIVELLVFIALGVAISLLVGGMIGGVSQNNRTPDSAAAVPEDIVSIGHDSDAAALLLYVEALDEIHWRESRRGADPRSRPGIVGPAGERGEFQVTPIFIADVERIAEFRIDPDDMASCRKGITIWLSHYSPRVGAVTTEELYQLYRRGPTGYRKWKGIE